jgi:hypothetical protein
MYAGGMHPGVGIRVAGLRVGNVGHDVEYFPGGVQFVFEPHKGSYNGLLCVSQPSQRIQLTIAQVEWGSQRACTSPETAPQLTSLLSLHSAPALSGIRQSNLIFGYASNRLACTQLA